MKTLGIFTLFLNLFILGAPAQTANTSQTTLGQTGQAASAPAIISRAANCNMWQYQTYETLPNGQIMTHPHTYMEMAGGLNQFDSTTGQWVPAQELIQPYAQGAIAQGQATVIYANNLNSASGVIDEETPDGQRLTSAISGLMYLDPTTGQSVQIAEVQDSYGQLIAANQVLYPNAFNGNGVKASVRFEYRRDGTEQDIILESQLPAPETFGLSSDTAELVVVTEFLNPPVATVSKTGSETAGLEPDEAISWGATSLGRGKAFSLAGQDVPVVVSKEYRNIDGRYFLFEKVRYKDIRASLSSLPLQSSNARSLPGMASKHLHLPKAPAGKRVDHPMRLALGQRPDKGYVFDYITLSTSFTNYNFQGDTSYFISGNVNLAGSNTFEGGAVVKYAANTSITIVPGGSVKFLSRPYRPVVFSCKDDNTVGQTISGSTGSPSGYYANPALNLGSLGSLALSEFRICYANRGLSASGTSPTIYDAQFVNCATAISDIIGLPSLENVLFSNTKTNFNSSNLIFPQSVYVQNGTFNNGFDLINGSVAGTSLYLTNCIFVNQTNLSGTIAAGYNGFYQSPTVGSPYVTSSTYPLQRAGAASCYLANGCAFLANGTRNVDPYGLSLIALKTVSPPLIYSNVSFSTAANFGPQVPRDNNGAPALGYHYDPLDYVFSGVSVYANMTFSAGTAVGWFELPNSGGAGYGLAPYDKVVLSFNGTASQPCTIARYCTVQEGGNGLWKNLGYMGAIVTQSSSGGYSMNPANAALTRTTFTRHALLAEGPNHYRENNALSQVAAQNSEFWGGDVGAYWDNLQATNCLFDRVAMGVGGSNPALWWMRNCTMHGGGLYLSEYNQTWPVWIEDCAFDGTTLQVDNNSHGNTNETYCDFNAFLANNTVLSAPGTHNVIVTSFNWQNGPLGNYYLPWNSPLIDGGSATADHMGLAEFTTQISECKEGISPLDIGYHYVAVDANGNPLDTFVPGTPDYLADANGNSLPDAWELQWFGNLSHFGSDLGNNGVTTLLFDYQNGLDPTAAWNILQGPVSQDVWAGDTVTFAVETVGVKPLTYQWTSNGLTLGVISSSYTIDSARYNDMANYACTVSDGTTSITTPVATLTVAQGGIPFQDPLVVNIISDRQNYTFKNGLTYLLSSPVRFFGNTVIEGGAILKFDNDDYPASPAPSLIVMGGLTCKGGPYNPAIMTSFDDDSEGEPPPYPWDTHMPQTAATGTPYLDLSHVQVNSICNLRVCYADRGVAAPGASGRLDAWNCQFVKCNYGLVDTTVGAMESLHNVLFAGCKSAVWTSGANVIEGEQVTADVSSFCLASTTPDQIALTNCLIWGNPPAAINLLTINTVFNPSSMNFQVAGAGNYYLAANSSYHQAGTPAISLQLQQMLQGKSTCPPIALPDFYPLSGSMTLAPQALRYTGGAPDLGYYYDAFDYTVANMQLNGGTLTILPGTAIGYRMINNSQQGIGFDVHESSTIVSQGKPEKPNIFADVQLVQEQQTSPVWAGFVPDFFPTDQSSQPPALYFRFSNFYVNSLPSLGSPACHFWSASDPSDFYLASDNSVMNFSLQDCSVYGGQIEIGPAAQWTGNSSGVWGSGTVTWTNSLFDNVYINVNPTYVDSTYYDNPGIMTADLVFSADNCLFHGGRTFHLGLIPDSGGNWTLNNNLFDQVAINQDPGDSLDFSNNGYWPLSDRQLFWDWYSYGGWNAQDYAQLQPTTTSDGSHDVVLGAAPPYQTGPLGNYYLPDNTPLYGAGSDTAANLGLFHYTTRLDQTKEGNDTPKVTVSGSTSYNANIGLHYIATSGSSSTTPMDWDGDGIPDYVENWHGDGDTAWGGATRVHTSDETDWKYPTGTDPTTGNQISDPYDTIYADRDLSGDGLVGRIKAALGMAPLDPSNPLILQQVGLDQETGVVTFDLPIPYSNLNGNGVLNLNMDGYDVCLKDLSPANDGSTLLRWNTLYDPPGQHYLQPEIDVSGTGEDTAITSGYGILASYLSDNAVQFFVSDSLYDSSSAYLDAQLPKQNASYTIRIYDPSTSPPTLLKTIPSVGSGSTSSGMIQEDWYFDINGSSSTFSGSSFTAEFDVTLRDNSGNALTESQQSETLSLISGRETRMPETETLDQFDFGFFYMPTNYLEQDFSFWYNGGDLWNGMENVVNTLQQPSSGYDVYPSDFDAFISPENVNGNPGYLVNQSIVTLLTNSLANGTTRLFYCAGHGTRSDLGNSLVGLQFGGASMHSWAIAQVLGNDQTWTPSLVSPKNPYRFVFLDGCLTASHDDWKNAFGILDDNEKWSASRSKLGPQAFVGWKNLMSAYLGISSVPDDSVNQCVQLQYTDTLNVFYLDWMLGSDLDECIRDASNPQSVSVPLPIPTIKHANVPQCGCVVENPYQSRLIVFGHTGLTIIGCKTEDDNDPDFKP